MREKFALADGFTHASSVMPWTCRQSRWEAARNRWCRRVGPTCAVAIDCPGLAKRRTIDVGAVAVIRRRIAAVMPEPSPRR